MNRKGFAPLVVIGIIGAIAIVGFGVWYFVAHKNSAAPTTPGGVACTQEAKQCPDGSYVGRTGPNCEFAACPAIVASSTPSTGTASSTINTSTWQTYTNTRYGFTISYPGYLDAAQTQTQTLFKADSATEEMQVVVIDKPLNGLEFLASDGVVGNSIFQYSGASNTWQYIGADLDDVGVANNASDTLEFQYQTSGSRPGDASTLSSEGYIPLKYQTKNGLSAWVGDSTDEHSTQGGDTWQIAFIENINKQFTVVVYMDQCAGYYSSCTNGSNDYLQSTSNSQTIFSVINTLQFGASAQ